MVKTIISRKAVDFSKHYNCTSRETIEADLHDIISSDKSSKIKTYTDLGVNEVINTHDFTMFVADLRKVVLDNDVFDDWEKQYVTACCLELKDGAAPIPRDVVAKYKLNKTNLKARLMKLKSKIQNIMNI